jgi:hypothetical protein
VFVYLLSLARRAQQPGLFTFDTGDSCSASFDEMERAARGEDGNTGVVFLNNDLSLPIDDGKTADFRRSTFPHLSYLYS